MYVVAQLWFRNMTIKSNHTFVLSNFTLTPFHEILAQSMQRMGLPSKVFSCAYDQVMQTCFAPPDLLLQANVIIVWLDLSFLLPSNFTIKYLPNKNILDAEKQRLIDYYDTCLAQLIHQKNATIFVVGLTPPQICHFDFLEQQRYNMLHVIESINKYLQYQSPHCSAFSFISLDHIHRTLGTTQFYDMRFYYLYKLPFSQTTLSYLAEQISTIYAIKQGCTKKVLVLDCDNVLWGGLVAEKGANGITLDRHHYPGNVYHDMQSLYLNLQRRGWLLALLSKNDECQVLNVFQNNPHMQLTLKHIVTKKINWQPKYINIRKISEELQLNLNSFVFIDDSPFEINQMRHFNPDVTCLHLDVDDLINQPTKLAQYPFFNQVIQSCTDATRTQSYRHSIKRQALRQNSKNLVSYLKQLGMKLHFQPMTHQSLPRCLQLIQRTNQFNLSTQRYSKSTLQEFLSQESLILFTISLSDHLETFGTIGLFTINLSDNECIIQDFILSCRVLGRGIEEASLTFICQTMHQYGYTRCRANYIANSRNHLVLKTLNAYGFRNCKLNMTHPPRQFQTYFSVTYSLPTNHKEIIHDHSETSY